MKISACHLKPGDIFEVDGKQYEALECHLGSSRHYRPIKSILTGIILDMTEREFYISGTGWKEVTLLKRWEYQYIRKRTLIEV